MPILTATEVTIYSNISASAATITASNLIPVVQDKITIHLNNYFVTDIYFQGSIVFNATARTAIMAGVALESYNFLAGDEVYVYNSYRNDGYYTIDSISGSVMTFISGSTVVDELSGRSILISVVSWPQRIKQIAAQMVEYDYDKRSQRTNNVKSHSLGPFSESYDLGTGGYPKALIDGLGDPIVRLM